MALTVTTSGAFTITGAQTFSGSAVHSTYSGLSIVKDEVITHPDTDQVIDIGIDNTARVKALFISVSAACTLKIDGGVGTCVCEAGDFLVMRGAACKKFLDGLSGTTTFLALKVTTSAANVTVNVAVYYDAQT